MAVSTGDRAPDFVLPLRPGEAPLRLSDYIGQRPVVLLFFPLAFSGTCTEELCRVAEDYGEWTALDAEVVGISVDSPYANQRFAREIDCPFPIVSDFNREASEAYGVLYQDYFGLKGVSKRAAFVVDRDGEVAYRWVSEDSGVLPPFGEIRDALAAVA